MAFHIAARPLAIIQAALPARRGGYSSGLDYRQPSVVGGTGTQSVGRAAWCATFVRGGLRLRPSCPGQCRVRVRAR